MSIQSSQLIGPLLRDVSRSFYLTLRVLPAEIRPQVSVAYLLARASDTIADTQAVPRAKRVVLLRQLQTLSPLPDPGAIADHQTSPGEKALLTRLDDCCAALDAFGEADGRRIQELLQIIISGQIFDLERFPGETEADLVALDDDNELDRYTYLVAGCVGEFWTRMCRAHLPELAGWNGGKMEELGVRFGKGLQLVNVLRDVPKDLRIGRCYLPVSDPRRLLDPANYTSVRTEYQRWLDVAVGHLDAAWEYTLRIPRSLKRLRLACIWPIWIGQQTVARLRVGNPLDPTQRIKIARAEVYALMARSLWCSRSDAALQREFQRLRTTTLGGRTPVARNLRTCMRRLTCDNAARGDHHVQAKQRKNESGTEPANGPDGH